MMPAMPGAATDQQPGVQAREGREAHRRLCIVADDFGLHPSIDQAVLQLVAMGRVHAVSVMSGAPAWPRSAGLLAAATAGRADVGLHLDLTAFPVQPLLRHGLGQWVGASFLRLVDRAAIEAEIGQQLQRFEAFFGRAPEHVDGHQHVHQLPVIREALVRLLRERYAGRLPWLRCTRRPRVAVRDAGHGKAAVIERLGAAGLRRLARRHGFAQNRHLLGVYGFEASPARHLQRLQGWLAQAEDGDLLMCHPARQAIEGDAIAVARVVEFNLLASEAMGRLLSASGVTLQRPGRAPGWWAAAAPARRESR